MTKSTNAIVKSMEVSSKSAFPTASHNEAAQLKAICMVEKSPSFLTYKEFPAWNTASSIKQGANKKFMYAQAQVSAKKDLVAYTSKELVKALGLPQAVTEQLILNRAEGLSKEEQLSLVSDSVLSQLTKEGLTIDTLKSISSKELKKLNLNRIVLSDMDQLEKALATLNPSSAFLANLNSLLAEGYSLYQMFKDVRSSFTYGEKGGQYGSAYHDAVVFKKFFKFEKSLANKLDTIIVRKAIIDDEDYQVLQGKNGEVKVNNVQLIEDSKDGVKKVFVVERFQSLSNSMLIEYIADLFGETSEEFIEMKKGFDYFLSQDGILKRVSDKDERAKFIRFMDHLLYVDAKMDLSKLDDAEESEEKERALVLKEMKDTAIHNGINVFRINKERQVNEIVGRFGTFIRTASQGRTQGFIALEGAQDPVFAVESLESMGHKFSSYAKEDKKDSQYLTIAIDKMSTRPGLLGSTSRPVKPLNDLLRGASVSEFGKDTGMREINTDLGQKILLTPDFNTEIKEGAYRVLNAIKAYREMCNNNDKLTQEQLASQFIQLDAAEHSLSLCVGDGQFFYGEEVHQIIINLYGKDNGVNQFRISPATKGLGVYYPNLEKETGYTMILPESAVKVPYHTVDLTKHPLEFAIANFGKEQGHLKDTFKLNYQFMSGLLNVSVDVFKSIIIETFGSLDELLEDPSKLFEYKKYEGILNQMSKGLEEGDESLVEESASRLIMTFDRVFSANQDTHKDVWVKAQAHSMMKKAFEKYGRGELQVQGNYRFMVQDPIGLIRHHRRNIDVVNNGKPELVSFDFVENYATIKAGTVYLPSNHSINPIEQEVLALRAPFIDPSEAQKLVARNYTAYEKLRYYNEAFVSSVIVFSGLDFAAFAMGGADFDGDKAGIVLDEVIVKSFIPSAPVLDMSIIDKTDDGHYVIEEGCIFKDTARNFPETTSSKLTRDGWNVKFLKSDIDDSEVKVAIFNYMKEYILDSMQPSKIGLYTDYATKLLDAINVLTANKCLSQDEGEIKYLEGRIHLLSQYVAILRIAQGWEIDRSKHGGAFENYINLDFTVNPPEEVSLQDVYGNFVLDKSGNRVWASLAWLELQRGKTPQQIVNKRIKMSKNYKAQLETRFDYLFTNSTQSIITKEAFYQYDSRFNENIVPNMNINDNNMLKEVSSLVFSNQPYFDEVSSVVREFVKFYNLEMRSIITESENRKDAALNNNKFRITRSVALRITEEEDKARKDEIQQLNDYCANQLREFYNEISQANDNADLLIGKAVYEIVYTAAIANYGRDKEPFMFNPARGTSYFWNVATDFAVALFAYLAKNEYILAYNNRQIAKLVKDNQLDTVNVTMFPSAEQKGNIEFTKALNAIVHMNVSQSIINAVRCEFRDGRESYMLVMGDKYVGCVAPSDFIKLGGADHIYIKAKSISNNVSKKDGTSLLDSLNIEIDTMVPSVVPEESKAIYAQLAIQNGHVNY